MAEHTPTPWKVVSVPHFDSGLVYTSIQPVNVDEEAMKPLAMANGEYHICRMSHTAAEWRFNLHRANAAFLVEAVNSYASLKAENERYRAALEFYRDGWRYAANPKHSNLEWKPKEAILADCGAVAREALYKGFRP